jgi:lipopolysaccharide transport system permease protein
LSIQADARIAAPEAPAETPSPPWVENRPLTGWRLNLGLREVWNARELALSFAVKDLAVRYKQTFFGVAWAILQPLIAALLFTVVFGRFAHLPTDGLPYVVFAFSGMTVWLYFSSSVAAAGQSLVENRDLVTKVYFPRFIAPLAAVVPALVALGISLVLLALIMAVEQTAPGFPIVLLPVWILAAVLVSLGIGLWLSALNVKYRDVKHVLPFLLQLWLFASPVGYSSSLVTGDWRYVYALNPMVGVLEGFRWSVAGASAPGLWLLPSLGVGVVLLLTGTVYFRRVEQHFADVI